MGTLYLFCNISVNLKLLQGKKEGRKERKEGRKEERKEEKERASFIISKSTERKNIFFFINENLILAQIYTAFVIW